MPINIFVATKDAETFIPINKAIIQIDQAAIIGQYIESEKSDMFNLTSLIKPDILIVDDTLSTVTLSIMVKEMLKIFPDAGVIGLYSPQKSHHEMDDFYSERFMKIIKPYDTENLQYAIDFLMHNLLEGFFASELDRIKRKKKSSKKFLPFFSPKDSAGKTTIIVNLAWMLSQVFKQKVLLLNMNSVFDDSDIYLNFKSYMTFDRIITDFSSPSTDVTRLLDKIEEHPEYSGLFVLSASDVPSQFRELGELENSLEYFMWQLESRFDWILIDTSSEINSDILKIIEISDTPFILIENHIIALRNLEIFFEIIKNFGGDTDKFSYIASRLSTDIGIKTDQLLKWFGSANRFFAFIPSKGKQAMESISRGAPMVSFMNNDGEFYRIFQAMAHKLTGIDPESGHENYLILNIKKFFGLVRKD